MGVDFRDDTRWKVYVHIIPKAVSGYENHKYYVGITSRDVKLRWGSKGYGYKGNDHFYRAIQKYGWDNIEHEIIAENLTQDEACNIEIALIKKLKSNDYYYGYNKSPGGDGNGSMSDEMRKIISLANKERWKNSEFRMAHSGKNHYLYGINRPVCDTDHYKKIVVCLNNKKEYESLTNAATESQASVANITNVCKGRIKSSGSNENGEKLVWAYLEDYKKMSDDEINKKIVDANKGKRKLVVNLTTNELFTSTYIAMKKYDISNAASISMSCRKGCNGKGYKWKYYEDYLKENNLTDEEARKRLFFVE